MKAITPTEILSYFDGIDLFAAEDAIGGNYVATLADDTLEAPRFLVVGVSQGQLDGVLSGQIDLKSLFENPAGGEWFFTDADADFGTPLPLARQDKRTIPNRYWPIEGITLEPATEDKSALTYAHERANCVFAFEVAASVRIDTLSELLAHLHTLVDQACRMAWRDLPLRQRREIDFAEAAAMQVVVPAVAGSYRMVLESVQRPDDVGTSELALGLEVIDELFANTHDIDAMLNIVGGRRTRLANTTSKLIRFLDDHDTGFTYGWATPHLSNARSGGITRDVAGSLSAGLFPHESRMVARRMFTGRLLKANLRTGTWGMRTYEAGYLTGRSRRGVHALRQAIIGADYSIDCEIEEHVDMLGKSKRINYLMSLTTFQPHLDMNLLERPPPTV